MAGFILCIFGCLFVSGSAVALSCLKNDKEMSAAGILELFVLGGIFSFFRDFFQAVSDAVRCRSSQGFPLLVLFCIGIVLFVTGCLMM